MNEARAIEFASVNGISVSTDSVRRFQKRGKWVRNTAFKVGAYTVMRLGDAREWQVYDEHAQRFEGRRGDCIEFCVRATLARRSDES
jgi:hypothetical protein